MLESIRGRAWCYGDNVDVEHILPGRYLKMAPQEAAKHVMAGVDPDFAGRVKPGDLLVGGRNFGVGSTREQATRALKLAGVGAVIAVSFGRIFYRNAINLGLPVLQCPGAREIRAGDELEVDIRAGLMRNLTQGAAYQASPLTGHVLQMIEAGGLVPYLEEMIRSGRLKPAPRPA